MNLKMHRWPCYGRFLRRGVPFTNVQVSNVVMFCTEFFDEM
jgi:hypothetical protein